MFLVQEVSKLDRDSRWNYTFQLLNLETRQNVENYTLHSARQPEHRNLNRYRDVLPYDHSRVKLESGSNDYINGNIVEVSDIGRKYILSQGPLPDTCGHFWQMIWEQNTTAIIMLNKIIEKNAVKCHPYWPMGEDEEIEFADFRIKNLSERSATAYVVRDLHLEHIASGDTRSIKQFHYMLWPDFGVPSRPETFLNFLYDIRESEVFSPKHGPPVIHCSAGIGRSGTFCLVDCILKQAENDGKPDNINVKQMLLKLRNYRVGLVQTPDQLRFSYLAIIQGLAKLFPECFKIDDEHTEESLKRKAEQMEPPPIPPRKRHPPEKPPRCPQNSETTAEQETLKQNRMVQRLRDGIVDESSSEEAGDDEILDLSESESENDVSDAVELYESEEEDHLVDNTSDGVISKPLPSHPPIDDTFPVDKPLPPLPLSDEDADLKQEEDEEEDQDKEDSKREDLASGESSQSDESGQTSSESSEDETEFAKPLPVFSAEEEGEDGENDNDNENIEKEFLDVRKAVMKNSPESTKVLAEKSISQNSVASGNVVDNETVQKSETVRGNIHQTLDGELIGGNKARDEIELRQRQRRDAKNKQTAEKVQEIKRNLLNRELAAAQWSMTKKSFIALGLCGGFLLVYYLMSG